MYSRGYFNSEWGGIEFQVFRSRVEEYIKDSPGEIGPPPLIIPVLWRPPRLLSGSMPKPLADLNIQYTHADLGEAYAREGLRTLVKQSRTYHDEYDRFLQRIAEKIVAEGEQNRLVPLEDLPPLKNIESAFMRPSAALAAPNTAGATVTDDNVGPATALFVYVAGRSIELEAVRPEARSYGTIGGRDWGPWDPPNPRAIGIIAQEIASAEDIFYEYLPVDDQLVDQLREAEDNNTMVLMVVDPWSIQVPIYRDKMLEDDRNLFANCAVMVVCYEDEQAPGPDKQNLPDHLQNTFFRTSNTTYFRYPIASLAQFEREVSSAIYEIRRRLMQKVQIDRPVPSGRALPAVAGPRDAR